MRPSVAFRPPLSRPHAIPMPPASASHILVIRGGAIGDFVLTLPVLAALRQHSPDSRLVVLGYPHIAQLAQAGGLADEVYSIAARALTAFFVRGEELPPETVSFFARFNLILSYLYDPDVTFHENLARCSGARLITGPPRPDESLPRHATETYLKPLEQLGIFGADPIPRLRIGLPSRQPWNDAAGLIDASQAHPDVPHTPDLDGIPHTVALHPGSGSERKNWPERKWDTLIDEILHQTPLNMLLVGGEAEGDRLPRLARGRSPWRLRLARSLPLVELARRLSECVAFVGHDSGISHLAAAVGLPGVFLWGDSIEAVWRPRSNGCMLLRDPGGLGQISVERVLAALCRLVEGSGLRKCAAPLPDPTSRAGSALPGAASMVPSFEP